MSGKVPIPQQSYAKRCCLDSSYYLTMYGNYNYKIGGYMFWNPEDRLNYACKQYEAPEKEGAEANCIDCHDEIMKCQ